MGERNVLEGLKEFNLVDAYRQLHPIPKKAMPAILMQIIELIFTNSIIFPTY